MRLRLFRATYAVANASLVGYGVFALVNPGGLLEPFLRYVYQFPSDALPALGYLSGLFRLLGWFNLVLGILGLILLQRHALTHEKWLAWAAMASSLAAYLGPIIFDNTVGRIGAPEIIEHILFAAMILGAFVFFGGQGASATASKTTSR